MAAPLGQTNQHHPRNARQRADGPAQGQQGSFHHIFNKSGKQGRSADGDDGADGHPRQPHRAVKGQRINHDGQGPQHKKPAVLPKCGAGPRNAAQCQQSLSETANPHSSSPDGSRADIGGESRGRACRAPNGTREQYPRDATRITLTACIGRVCHRVTPTVFQPATPAQ